MKFVVYSRATMTVSSPPQKPWAVISICEEADFPDIYENEFLRGRLNLRFHDVDKDPSQDPQYEWDYPGAPDLPPTGHGPILFSDDHAKQIVDFVQGQLELDTSVIYVHCLMGQCRSAGVAAALDKTLNGDDMRYFSSGGPYRPNMRVYRGVLNECHDRGLLG